MQSTYNQRAVGVNLAAPKYALDVAGGINFTGSLTSNGVTFFGASGGGSNVCLSNAAGGATFYNVGSNVGLGQPNPQCTLDVAGDINAGFNINSANYNCNGAQASFGGLTAASKNFMIPHPVLALAGTHNLVHACIEAPRYDLMYRGIAKLEGGVAAVDVTATCNRSGGVAPGTLSALTRDAQVFLSNNAGFDKVIGSLRGETLDIRSDNSACSDVIDWMVVAERADPHVYASEHTDEEGRLVCESSKA